MKIPAPERPSPFASRRYVWLAVGCLGFLALVAYHNSFSVPFLFDDDPSIPDNPTIRHLWPLTRVLSPPAEAGVASRPLLNLSFAFNYAFGGTAVRGYHLVNLAIHVLAGLTVLGIVRRTLLQPARQGRFGAIALPLAVAIAALWTLHPLQTAAVTYLSQRAESLMGLFYLQTLYCFVRGTESRSPGYWMGGAVVACWLGMATKEVMVSAPLLVLLYDRTFVAGTFREAWRQRWRWYLGLAGSWCLLGFLMAHGLSRVGVGYGLGVSGWTYALTECRAVVHYLRLTVWPHPLVFDYGTDFVPRIGAVLPAAVVLVLLVGSTLIAVWRRPVCGFLGAWFFLILAPTSSVVPLATQPMAENRVYLPSLAVIVLAVVGLHRLAGKRSLVVYPVLILGLGWLTLQRNGDYRSAETLWSDAIVKLPGNARAHNNLGQLIVDTRPAEAMAHYEEALRLKPNYADAHFNLAVALMRTGHPAEAIAHYRQGLRWEPDDARAHYNLANALAQAGQWPEAVDHYRQAVQSKPDYPEAYYDLGNAFLRMGRGAEAVGPFEQAVRLKPDFAEAHCNLGTALSGLGRVPAAIAHLEQAVQLQPRYVEAHYNLANALVQAGRKTEAIAHYEQALRLNPELAEAHNNLADTLLQMNRATEAIGHLEQALRINPNYVEAHTNLGTALAGLGRKAEAIEQFEQALRIRPDFTEAREKLSRLRPGQSQ